MDAGKNTKGDSTRGREKVARESVKGTSTCLMRLWVRATSSSVEVGCNSKLPKGKQSNPKKGVDLYNKNQKKERGEEREEGAGAVSMGVLGG